MQMSNGGDLKALWCRATRERWFIHTALYL